MERVYWMHKSFSVCGDNIYVKQGVRHILPVCWKCWVSFDGEHFRNKNETFAFEQDLELKLQTLTL